VAGQVAHLEKHAQQIQALRAAWRQSRQQP
jgi:hypothetical protein